tara:strand:- start:1305 stop:2543 length:1239 start_codon:yes stop_codon:yes gene_type:complete
MSLVDGFEPNQIAVYDLAFDRFDIGDMDDYPKFEFGKREVRRVGDALKEKLIPIDKASEEEIRQIFRVAHSWRDSHALPMRLMRRELIVRIRQCELVGLTVARLKRMQSIRRKLREQTGNLTQMQDLGGCRAILPSIADVNRLIQGIKENSRHNFINESDYILRPKLGGYRSHHLIYGFSGTGKYEPFDGRRIEMQIRTRLQHSWATAVEAVGLIRGEDMKAGKGDKDWLRLFELMSAEIAIAEKCPEPEGLPSRPNRIREITELERALNAVSTLDDFRNAVQTSDTLYTQGSRPAYYMLEYDKVLKTVSLRGFSRAVAGAKAYDSAEEGDEAVSSVVLIEADRVETLKKAYPNYFGDTYVFMQNLKAITLGKQAVEYAVPLRRVAPHVRESKVKADLSWFSEHRRRNWNPR